MTEQQYADLLERATDDLAPGRDLVTGAITTGRRRRRARLVGVVAVMAVAGGALVALPGASDERGSTVVADPASSAAPTATPSLTPAPLTGTMAAALTASLAARPGGDRDVTDPRNWGDADFRAASVLLAGALVTVLVERTTLPRCGEQPPGSACDSVGDGFASTASYDEPAPGGTGTTGVRTSTATLFTSDHLAITATAYNAPAEKGAAPISDRPVLSEAELLALVQDPIWRRALL